MYKATILKIKNVRPHSNADRVLLATCHGNQVVVGIDTKEGDLGIYFPTDGQLSHEVCHYNNLYRESSLNYEPDGKTGMFDTNRRVRTQKFRGEISDGFWMPINMLDFIENKLNKKLLPLDEGLVSFCWNIENENFNPGHYNISNYDVEYIKNSEAYKLLPIELDGLNSKEVDTNGNITNEIHCSIT